MRSAAKIITRLSSRGITLTPDGDRLHARPASRMTSDELKAIHQHKPAIVRLLTQMIEAADAVNNDPPRPLEPREKATLARLVRLEHKVSGNRAGLQDALDCPDRTCVVDVHIRDAIEASEADPPMRAYLLTLAENAGRRDLIRPLSSQNSKDDD